MSKVIIIPFENKHAEYIVSQKMNDKFLELSPHHKKYAYFLKEVGMSFTGVVNNEPIAAGGIFPLWEGVAEGWVLATNKIHQYPITLSKVIKKRTELMCLNYKIKRLQTSVKADSKMAIRFAEWLGLKQEGIMKQYGPDGSDYYRYARLF
jgi:hypothetical protein